MSAPRTDLVKYETGTDAPILYEKARLALAEAVRVEDAKDIRDWAATWQFWAKRAKDRTAIELATECILRAELRAGELRLDMPKNKGAVPGKTGRKGKPVLDSTPRLSDLGITKTQSARWQRLARLSPQEFEAKVTATKRAMVNKFDGVSKFDAGTGVDGKHYWLTPPDVRAALDAKFNFDFDPCPYPRPEGFDGLKCEWGKSNYLNPPFGVVRDEDGRRLGLTAWVRKAIEEQKKDKRIVMPYPLDYGMHMLLAAGARYHCNLGNVRFRATEDGSEGNGAGRQIALFVLESGEVAEKAPAPNYRSHGTGDEWYTPPEYVELARVVLGVIELDPASSDKAQETVKAERYFTRDDDGLRQEWHGRVWLNPPYSQPSITNFVNKMLSERAAGRVPAGIMITNNCTDVAWFQQAAQAADAVCFTRGRLKFRDASGAECGTPTQGQAFFYFGDDVSSFITRFREKGVIMVSAQSRAGPDIEPLPWHHHKCAPADRMNGRRGRPAHHAGMRQRDVPDFLSLPASHRSCTTEGANHESRRYQCCDLPR